MSSDIILLVEDNPDDAALTLRAFKKNKIASELVVVRDGVEALDYLFGGGSARALPKVVLLDLKLPKINGLEVLKRVRSHPSTKLLPIVMLTSSKEERDRVESYRLGCNSYVRKPVDFALFLEVAQQLGRYWLTLNEAAPLE